MGVPSKNSSVLDMGRRPELKSDEFFEGTPLSSRDNCIFVLETAQESGSVIGGATPRKLSRVRHALRVRANVTAYR